MLKVLDKLFCLLVCIPPLYFFGRFITWYIRQNREHHETMIEETEPTK